MAPTLVETLSSIPSNYLPSPISLVPVRITVRSFQGVIDVLSPTSARTRLVTNIDPNLRFVPQSLIDFCMKKMCGILLLPIAGRSPGCDQGSRPFSPRPSNA